MSHKVAATSSHLSLVTAAVFFFASLSTGWAADIVLVQGKRPHPVEQEQIRALADFYGVELRTFVVDSQDAVDRVVSQLKRSDTLAFLVSQDALSGLDQKRIQAALRRPRGPGIPMLVFGVAAQEPANILKLWSRGAIQECAPLVNFRPKVLEVGNVGPLARTLAGFELPAVASPACAMRFEDGPKVQAVLAARGDGATNPVLLRAQAKSTDVFFVPEMQPFDLSWLGKPRALRQAFSSMAPFIMFLSYAVGDRGWHLDGHYANLTIDDAWLTQPYGSLDYPGLLAQMEKHNFHTTIAFIPWNFDRSQLGVVNLFLAHPERFSICVHGNDHKHQEFGDYAAHPLPAQIADIRQGVARMERFRLLTGIPYDRFMVFPHAIAPGETLAALRTYDFLGTANSEDVPLGATFPTDPAFLLRPYTVAYANFLSLSRLNQVSRLEVAIDSFLGNPVLFFGHESLFAKGIGAFDESAELVNHIQPETQWASLGEIARHLYLIRRRADGGFDVQMLANEMDLKNPMDRDEVFYIQRQESASAAIRSLTIDGAPVAFERSPNVLTLRLLIPAHGVRKLRLVYQNDLDPSREDIGKGNLYAYALRLISDFRDMYLSRLSLGRVITQSYYRRGWDSIELRLERTWWVGLVCMGLALGGVWYRRRISRKRAMQRAAGN